MHYEILQDIDNYNYIQIVNGKRQDWENIRWRKSISGINRYPKFSVYEKPYIYILDSISRDFEKSDFFKYVKNMGKINNYSVYALNPKKNIIDTGDSIMELNPFNNKIVRIRKISFREIEDSLFSPEELYYSNIYCTKVFLDFILEIEDSGLIFRNTSLKL